MFSSYIRVMTLTILSLSAMCPLYSADTQPSPAKSVRKPLTGILTVATDSTQQKPSVLLISKKGSNWSLIPTFFSDPDQDDAEMTLKEQTKGKYDLDLTTAVKEVITQGTLRGANIYIVSVPFIQAESLKTADADFIWVPIDEFSPSQSLMSKQSPSSKTKLLVDPHLQTFIKSRAALLTSTAAQPLPQKGNKPAHLAPQTQTQTRTTPYLGTQAGQTRSYGSGQSLQPQSQAPSQQTRTTPYLGAHPGQTRSYGTEQYVQPQSQTAPQQTLTNPYLGAQPSQARSYGSGSYQEPSSYKAPSPLLQPQTSYTSPYSQSFPPVSQQTDPRGIPFSDIQQRYPYMDKQAQLDIWQRESTQKLREWQKTQTGETEESYR